MVSSESFRCLFFFCAGVVVAGGTTYLLLGSLYEEGWVVAGLGVVGLVVGAKGGFKRG